MNHKAHKKTTNRTMIIYIAHPISGDITVNLIRVKRIYRKLALEGKVAPIAPHFLSCCALDDTIQGERKAGIRVNEVILKSGLVDELWLYGDCISEGMGQEIKLAQELNIPVVSKSDKINNHEIKYLNQ